jgi:hypothetical protein
MTTLCLTNDTLSVDDFATLVEAVKYYVPLISSAWKLPAVTITTTPTKGAWVVNLTEKNRRTGAGGYHNVTDGTPTAWCSPAASGRLWGHYGAPLISRAITVKGKVIKAAKEIHGASYTPGLVTVVLHEIAEMLADSVITTYSLPDAQGRQWLVEPCDHCFGTYQVHSIGAVVCVFPNVTTPAFYDLKAKAPYDLLGVVTAPFTMTPKGYAFYKTPTGLVKI